MKKTRLFLRKYRIAPVKSSKVLGGIWFEGGVDGGCCLCCFICLI